MNVYIYFQAAGRAFRFASRLISCDGASPRPEKPGRPRGPDGKKLPRRAKAEDGQTIRGTNMKQQDVGDSGEDAAVVRSGGFRTAEVLVHGERKFHTVPVTGAGRQEPPASVRRRWQRSLDVLAGSLGAAVGLVTRIAEGGLSVFVMSGEQAGPYAPDACFPFGSGSYCEEAIGQNRFVSIDTKAWAEADSGAMDCPFCRYCGLPLHWEDGSFFGTLCLFGRGEALAGPSVRNLMEEFAASLEKDLELLDLRKSQDSPYEKYGQVMEAVLQYAPGGIFCYSAEQDEQFSYLSDNMLRFLGYTRREFVEKFSNRFSRMVYEPDRERVLQEIDEQIRCGSFDRCEYRIEKKDGSLVWVHDEGHIIADGEGRRWFYVVIVDITESVQAQERERRKFRSSMQALLAANPEAAGTVQFNLTKNLCEEGHGLGESIRRIVASRTADELFAAIAAQIADPETRRAFSARFDRRALLARFQNGSSSQSMEYLRKNDQGRLVWIRIYLNLLQNPDTGDVEGVAYSVDISLEKRRDEILSIITSQEHDLIALLHLDTGEVEAYFLGRTLPRAFRDMLPAPGAVCSLERFRQNALEHWVNAEDREKYSRCSDPACYRPVMDRGERYEFVVRERFPDVDGGEMYRKFQHFYLGSDRDTVLVIESDVTESCRRQQQELRAAVAEADRIQDIMNTITSGICVLHMPDREHLQIVYVNRQMFRLLGFQPGRNDIGNPASHSEELVRKYSDNAYYGVHPDDLERVRSAFRDHFESDYFVIDNYRTLGANGVYHWIKEEVRLREITPGHRIFYATFHDVSEEVRLNAELTAQLETEKQLRVEATAANAAKTDFLSRMSHDIRTPLNGIIGMTYLAREQDNPAATADCLEKIDCSSKFLLGLINDILDMSRAESREFSLNPEPYPLGEFNGYLDAVIRPLCREKGQQFVLDERFSIVDRVPVADKLRCNQIIFNLLSNAVKYTPEGGTITYRIRGTRLDGGRVEIEHEISDTGIGISEEFQKVLFDPFTQENRNDVSETRGTGLGLAIVRKLVDRMGGTIRVQSALGRGTTFLVTLAFDTVPVSEAAAPAAETPGPGGEPRLRERHVLLCEDHPLNQQITKTLLEQQGAFVEVAENGRAGLAKFAASPLRYYDIILMDIRMPVMDGYEAARAIRALPREDAAGIPILAMTADAFSGDVQKCLDAGMDGHVAKPISPRQLFGKMAELISKTGKGAAQHA
jgi:PAS domain S-box-containing protein